MLRCSQLALSASIALALASVGCGDTSAPHTPAGALPPAGKFALTGSMAGPRQGQTGTLLPSGKVFIAGGALILGGDNRGSALTGAELYDPATGMFTATGNMTIGRWLHTATLLPDGTVLMTGGQSALVDNYFDTTTASAELYDPTTGTFTATESMNEKRKDHTATLMTDKVLIAGGFASGFPLKSAEFFDPVTGTFTPTGNMATARESHTATLLPNGKVLIAGGRGNDSSLASAELYDPATGTFTATGNMTAERWSATATLLPNGQVLLAGGQDGVGALASAELYNPTTGTFAPTGSLVTGRVNHTATLLTNGKVLIAGGYAAGGPYAGAELYDPGTGTFTSTGGMQVARATHTETLLARGEVLVTGGEGAPHPEMISGSELYTNTFSSAELYTP